MTDKEKETWNKMVWQIAKLGYSDENEGQKKLVDEKISPKLFNLAKEIIKENISRNLLSNI